MVNKAIKEIERQRHARGRLGAFISQPGVTIYNLKLAQACPTIMPCISLVVSILFSAQSFKFSVVGSCNDCVSGLSSFKWSLLLGWFYNYYYYVLAIIIMYNYKISVCRK